MSSIEYDNNTALMATYNFNNHIKRIVQELQGIAAAIIYDNKIEDSEIDLLHEWVTKNSEYLSNYPLSDLKSLIKNIMHDGIITDQEKVDMYKFLSSFATLPQCDPVIEGIFNKFPTIEFFNKKFLFTGVLEYGTRQKAINAVTKLGGKASTSSSFTLKDDYLVIGILGSNDYKYGRFGSKIERALELIRDGKSTAQIIRERDFVAAVLQKNNELQLRIDETIKAGHEKACPYCAKPIKKMYICCKECGSLLSQE